jgi:hypothetical protein
VTTYSGTGSARDVSIGWKPDLVWIKVRGVSDHHILYDTVRGAQQNQLYSNVNNVTEETETKV